MSIFNELLPNLFEISNLCSKNFNRDLKDALESLDKFEEEFKAQNGRSKARERAQKDKKITLQSIDEGADESNKQSNPSSAKENSETLSNSQSSNEGKPRAAKKRSKHEVDDMSSPEQDKRAKRNASVKAQSIISKQVNVNLTQKLRRGNSSDNAPERQSSRSRRNKDDEKENMAPQELSTVKIKQEKISIPSETEPMETEALSLLSEDEIKAERHKDDIAMPPPVAPVPKPRKALAKEKPQETAQAQEPTTAGEELPARRSSRSTRNKKLAEQPPVAAARSTRASSRVQEREEPPTAAPEPRPKRTRGRKKLSETRADSGNSSATHSSADSLPASPAEKPRPKRTRRGQKADQEKPKPVEPVPVETKAIEPDLIVSPKDERPSGEPQQTSSPILILNDVKSKNKKDKAENLAKTKLTKANNTDKYLINKNVDKGLADAENIDKNIITKSKTNKEVFEAKYDKDVSKTKNDKDLAKTKNDKDLAKTKPDLLIAKTAENLVTSVDTVDNIALDETRVISKTDMDQTVVLPNGVYNHAPITPKNIRVNETMVLEQTMILERPNTVMDATVVLDKVAVPSNVTEDDSLLTDDSDSEEIPSTPAKKGVPDEQPLSAVKEKVQQFEEMASRVTRTKTRAMAKKEDDKETESQTPPDKVCKVIISSETLNKMNSLIFNGKPPQVSNSACKPRAVVPNKQVTASASKAAAISKAREAADENLKREDARQKKEALLEAKREQQKRKREEKVAAAAAARSAAEQSRRALLEAAARERRERQHHADHEKHRLLREADRKKQEAARKAAETEERRRAEESARLQRLAEEQRRALDLQLRRHEEAEAVRREEARMAKEIEKKQREYNEKLKKQKIDKMHTPFKTPLGGPRPPLPAVYMEDGFQYLNSDEDAEPPERPVPAWSSSKVRRHRLSIQKRLRRQVVDEWFRVGACTPDLAEIFPSIERATLKRTSSAVWHTPPPLPPALHALHTARD